MWSCLPASAKGRGVAPTLRGSRIHQSRDRAVERFAGPAHLVDRVDGLQHSGVMPAAELPADFLKRRPGDLPGDVHCDLAPEGRMRAGWCAP